MSFCSRVSGTPLFQSTLSVRRATARLVGVVKLQLISIHALRKESDKSTKASDGGQYFNPRSP